MLKTLATVTVAAVLLLPAPDARADPSDYCPYSGCRTPAWPGQLQDTWNQFPYGAWDGTAQCNTVTTECGSVATKPNRR